MAWTKLVISLLLFILSIASFPHWKGMYDFAVISPNTETNTVASIGIMRFPQFFVYRDVSYNWATMGGDALGNLKGGTSADKAKKLADNDVKKYKNSRKRFKELNLILPQKGDTSQKASLDININKNPFTSKNVRSSAVSLYNVANGQTTANTGAFVHTAFTYVAGTKPSQTHEEDVYEFYTKLTEACKPTTAATDTKCVALTPSALPQIVSNELHPWLKDTSNKPSGTSPRDFKYEKFNLKADCITKFGAKLGLAHATNGNYWLKQDGDMDKGELGAAATVNAYNALCRSAAFTPKCQCKAQGTGRVGTTTDALTAELVTNFQEGKKDFTADSDTGMFLFNKKGPNSFLWKDTSWGAAIMFLIIFVHSVASPFLHEGVTFNEFGLRIWSLLEVLVYLWQWVVIVFLLMHLTAHNTMAYGFTSFLSESQEFAPDTLIRIEGPINDYKIAIAVFAFFLVFVDSVLFYLSTENFWKGIRNCYTDCDCKGSSSGSQTTTVAQFGF